jgi:hypothetical protein
MIKIKKYTLIFGAGMGKIRSGCLHVQLHYHRAQTFVVFYFPRSDVGLYVLPLVELWDAVKGQLLLLVSGLEEIKN